MVAAVVGVIVAVLVWPWLGVAAIAAGWVGFCLTFCLRTLAALWRFTPEQTAEHATTEDPSHVVVTATLILASLASVAGVGVHPGMTYHDSDTTLQTRLVRRAALGHALLSYLLGRWRWPARSTSWCNWLRSRSVARMNWICRRANRPDLPRCARVAFGFGLPEHDRPQVPPFVRVGLR